MSPPTCNSSIPVCRAPFPPPDKNSSAQTSELNRGRTEERCLSAFEIRATRVEFPFAEQAARLTRSIRHRGKPTNEIETEYLMTSRSAAQLNAEQMLAADRQYWGIENGLHQRLDVIAGEDRSRVQTRNSVMNLAVIRRAVVSLAMHWISRCQNSRLASTSGFYDWMSAHNGEKALKLVTASKPSWLPDS